MRQKILNQMVDIVKVLRSSQDSSNTQQQLSQNINLQKINSNKFHDALQIQKTLLLIFMLRHLLELSVLVCVLLSVRFLLFCLYSGEEPEQAMWSFGDMNDEDLIHQLLKERKWEEAIQVATQSTKQHFGRGSFKIWYYKALAECTLNKLQQCERSTIEASFLANGLHKNSIAKLTKFVQILKPNHSTLEPSLTLI